MQTFDITYRLTLFHEDSIDQKIENICLEQSVELPRLALLSHIDNNVTGDPKHVEEIADGVFEAIISWPVENIGYEITQFLNLLYGNISLQQGIQITEVAWENLPKKLFIGPSFGIQKLRSLYNVETRALSATVLKPLGSSVEELSDLCYEFACGGIDIIKDDHGLANQSYAPFSERLACCVGAIHKAAEKTGRRSYYFPNITASPMVAEARYVQAAEHGADGVLLCPHITGLAMMHTLAQLDLGLPIIAHPSFSGSLVNHSNQGFTPGFLYGQLWRALGADFAIYPNTGGRFSFTLEQCQEINQAARNEKSPYKSALPMPGGGMQLDDLAKWKETYGPDTVFLMGGSLYKHPEGVRAAAQNFSNLLKSKSDE